jgi:hypothetical protein
MRKGLGGYLAGGIVALLAIAALFMTPWQQLGLIEGGCQDIYAYYPSFRCCDEIKEAQGSETLSFSLIFRDDGQLWQCPPNINRCNIKPDGLGVYYGLNCGWSGLFGEAWQCADDVQLSHNVWTSVPGGSYVHLLTSGTVTIAYENYDMTLCECSLSPCGVPCPKVLGADGCGFNTNEAIYDENGRTLIDPEPFYAYTVPFGSCYSYFPEINRHPIGNTCEECQDTADCRDRYGSAYNYLGTEYGATCGSGHVQIYDCLATGGEVCVKERMDADGNFIECMEWGQQSRCDLKLAIPVQCCPGDSSCGPQAFCDTDYTCKATAECVSDGDCGHTVMCDYATTTLKTPACRNGACVFLEEDVDCCGDGNCPIGYYCASDYTCKQETDAKKDCPFECCANEQEFFDRPCVIGNVCCPDHTCQASCGGGGDDIVWLWLIIPILAVALGAAGYYASEITGAVILGAIGGIIGYLIYWFMSLEWWAQALLFIGLGGLGALGIYLFGGVIAAIIVAFVVAKVGK